MKIMKIFSSIVMPVAIVYTIVLSAGNISVASEKEKDSDAKIAFFIGSEKVNRVEVLRRFLAKYDSPLVENAETFVRTADKFGMDYRLLPAISCMESVCGKRLPYNSNNAWGWGIYGDNVIYFESFDEGIQTVGKGISENYISRGLDTPAKMAPIYTPPRPQHWLNGVTSFINQMDEVSKQINESSV